MKQKRDHISVLTASIFGVSPRYVRMIRDGHRANPKIEKIYQTLKKDIDLIIEAARGSITPDATSLN